MGIAALNPVDAVHTDIDLFHTIPIDQTQEDVAISTSRIRPAGF